MSQLKVVSIMDYPREPHFLRMCYVFLDSVITHGAKSVTLIYEEQRPVIAPEHRRAADVELVKGRSLDVGHPHFNLRFKLPNLASLPFPFLYLDADMVVLSDLSYLWERRTAKPWIGVNHQYIPFLPRTHRPSPPRAARRAPWWQTRRPWSPRSSRPPGATATLRRRARATN